MLAEFEQASLTEKKAGTGNNRSEAVKLKSLEAEKGEKGKGKGKDRSERSHEEESGKAKCRFFLTDQGWRDVEPGCGRSSNEERKKFWKGI